MGRGQVASKQKNSVESYGGSPMPLEGLRGSSQVKSGAPIFIWQSYYSQWKIKIEPTIKLNHNIYMSVPSFGRQWEPLHLDLRGETLNHHIVAMGSSSEPSFLGNPITSTDKLLGHVCFMGKVFKIFKSQPYSTWTEKMLKLKQHTVLAIVNIANI